MRALVTDRQIWRAKYYETFTRRRIPAATGAGDGSIDWKSRYKTRRNWANGRAHLHELELECPPVPTVIAKVHDGMIFTCDASGLRAWSSSKHGGRTLQAQLQLDNAQAICIAAETVDDHINVLLGFRDGSFTIYRYTRDYLWDCESSQTTVDGPLVAASLAYPFATTVSQTKFLNIYRLSSADRYNETTAPTYGTIARLQSDASFSPISVSVRHTPNGIIAAVAYAFKQLHSGWCIGLQEVRLSSNGQLLDSRMASSLEPGTNYEAVQSKEWNLSTRFTSSNPLPLHPQLMSPPTSISYEHPYLICTLADNTMMSFLVASNDLRLDISSGRRLWGHTSAISGATVNNRGKAVSISSRGDETRVWELEGAITSVQNKSSTAIKTVDNLSTVAAALARRGSGLGLALREVKRELELTRSWVGFDEQQVVVLGETSDRKQIMALYDFT